jgi:phosphopantetheinyl transferase
MTSYNYYITIKQSVVKIVGGVMITQNDSLSLLASMTYMSNTANQIILLCLPSSALTYTM